MRKIITMTVLALSMIYIAGADSLTNAGVAIYGLILAALWVGVREMNRKREKE